MDRLIKDIISKKELNNLDENFIKQKLELFFKENKKIKLKLENNSYHEKSKEYKETIKSIRKELREIYGVFIQKNIDKRDNFLKENKTKEILLMHKSSEERYLYYEEIYKRIFKITNKPKKILDLACGLNPISYEYLGCKPKYYASDLSNKDMSFINYFFEKNKIKGKAFALDLIKDYEELKKYKVDVCFLFKALDSFETIKKNVSKDIIKAINAKFIIVSFTKTSLGGRKEISKNKRNWFINDLKKQGLSHEFFEIPNEWFVVVKK